MTAQPESTQPEAGDVMDIINVDNASAYNFLLRYELAGSWRAHWYISMIA